MKQFFLLCLLCFFCLGLGAQRFRPLLPGHLHFFQSTSNYSIRVDSVGEVNGDSTFWLNEIARPRPSGCPNYYHFLPHQEGLYGDRFVEMADGRMAFVSRAGDSAFFETTVPTGTSWTFATTGALTATLSNRSQSSFMGVTDSVLTIDISDGQQFQLTEHHGFLSAVNLGHYLNGANPMASTLHELPAVPDFKRFYDWQPTDRYGTWFHTNSGAGYDSYHRYTVMNRWVSSAADTLAFTLQDESVMIWFQNGGTYVNPMTTEVPYLRAAEHGFLHSATYEVWADSNYCYWQQPWDLNGFNNRMRVPYLYTAAEGLIDSCGFMPLMMFPEQAQLPIQYTRGLGKTLHETFIGNTTSGYVTGIFRMVCYEQAGQDSFLPCPAEFLLLATDNTTPAEEKISAWLDAHQQTQGIRWEGLLADDYRLELIDMSGRKLWESERYMDPSGSLQLPAGLPMGICLLRLSNHAKSWAATVKIPVLQN